MNKHVLEHVPVSQLPDELREKLPGVRTVTITAENGGATPRAKTLEAIRARQLDQRSHGIAPEQAAARVRAARDEWDD